MSYVPNDDPTSHKTLLDKWRYLMKDVTSPDSYIDMGFYYIIGAALQRRVWVGPNHEPIFPNPYIIMVGPPGTGKGRVLKVVNKILKYHHLMPKKESDSLDEITKTIDPDEIRMKVLEYMEDNASSAEKIKTKEIPLLIPVAADSTSYQALLNSLEKAIRVHHYKVPKPDGEMATKRYSYSALCFCLEELSSLLRKHTEDIVNFLLVGFDCGDYTYDTKHQGKNAIQRCCLSFFAGTTPDFLEDTFNSSLIGSGFTARVIFDYEAVPRFHKFQREEWNELQVKYNLEMINRVKQLTQLYGQATYSAEAYAYLREYFEEIHPVNRVNNHPKLAPYYERKILHMQKMAMAIHYADSDSMVIEKSSCVAAHNVLADLERKMHLALNFGGKNPLAKATSQVEKFINTSKKPLTFIELWGEFVGEVRESELREILDFLRRLNKIEYRDVTIGDTTRTAYVKRDYDE